MKRSVIFLGHIVSDKEIFPEASEVDKAVDISLRLHVLRT